MLLREFKSFSMKLIQPLGYALFDLDIVTIKN